MRFPSTRLVSLLLVTVFATLASAGAVCLVPCELAADAPLVHDTSPADHCAGSQAAVPAPGQSAVTGVDASCGGHHAWDGPAADRTATRASAGIVSTSTSLTVLSQDDVMAPLRGSSILLPLRASPPPGRTPLRI